MYNDKLMPILSDIERKEIDIAGGSVVGMILSIVNSLITYTCNLTKDKKKYENVRDEVIKSIEEAKNLRDKSIEAIDIDKKMVREILDAYKNRKEVPQEYENIMEKSTLFCIDVTKIALDTLILANEISKIGNRMLSSDFRICILYSYASVEASIENVKINVVEIQNEELRNRLTLEYQKILEEAKKYI